MQAGSVNAKKLEKRLYRQVGQAVQDYNMIEEGDRVMVCLSGGKDIRTGTRSVKIACLDTALQDDWQRPIFTLPLFSLECLSLRF